MNTELYTSLANAHAVLKEMEALNVLIKAQQEQMKEETEPQRLRRRLENFRYEKRLRLGYLFGAIGTLGTLGLLAVIPSLIDRFDEVIGSAVLLAIVFLPPLLVGGLLLRSFYKEKRDLRLALAAAEQRRALLSPARIAEIEACKARVADLTRQARQVWEQKGGHLNFLPRDYINLPCVAFMLEKVQKGQVKNLRHALYLAERLRTEPPEDHTGEALADGILDTVLDAIFH